MSKLRKLWNDFSVRLDMKKLLIAGFPYILFGYLFNKLAWLYRMSMAADMLGKLMDVAEHFVFESVYFNPLAKGEEGKAEDLVCQLFDYYMHHTDKLPSEYQDILMREGAQRAVVDYIAGMTDTYAVVSCLFL